MTGHSMTAFYRNFHKKSPWQLTAWQLFMVFFGKMIMTGHSMTAFCKVFKVFNYDRWQHNSLFCHSKTRSWQDDRFFSVYDRFMGHYRCQHNGVSRITTYASSQLHHLSILVYVYHDRSLHDSFLSVFDKISSWQVIAWQLFISFW